MHWEGLLLLMEELLRKALIFVSGWFPSLLVMLSLHVRFMFISKSVFVVVYVFICASVSSSHHLPSGPVWPFLRTRLADPKMRMYLHFAVVSAFVIGYVLIFVLSCILFTPSSKWARLAFSSHAACGSENGNDEISDLPLATAGCPRLLIRQSAR